MTGLLVAGGNRYLQVLEGQDAVVAALMNRIERDLEVRRNVGGGPAIVEQVNRFAYEQRRTLHHLRLG